MPSIHIESTNSMITVLGKNSGQASLESTCSNMASHACLLVEFPDLFDVPKKSDQVALPHW